MSFFDYIAFPRELNGYFIKDIVGSEKKFGINYDITHLCKDLLLFPHKTPNEGYIYLRDKNEAIFKDCFKNKYIFEYDVDLHLAGIHSFLFSNAKLYKELENISNEFANTHKSLINVTLFVLIKQNTVPGDFVELYSEFGNHNDFKFGPPSQEIFVPINEFVSFDMPHKREKIKITITT